MTFQLSFPMTIFNSGPNSRVARIVLEVLT
jgi:hypothetical protein